MSGLVTKSPRGIWNLEMPLSERQRKFQQKGAIALLIVTLLVKKWEQYQMRYCKLVKEGWNSPHKWSNVVY